MRFRVFQQNRPEAVVSLICPKSGVFFPAAIVDVGAGTLERYNGATISRGLKNGNKASTKSAKWPCDKVATSQGGELFPGAYCLLVLTALCRFSGQRE